MEESGWRPGIQLDVLCHVSEMQRIAYDTTGMQVKLLTESGDSVTALELQRHYHDAALRAAVCTPELMPPWSRL